MKSLAEQIVQKQLVAYNEHDLDAFSALFAEEVVIEKLDTGEVLAHGKDEVRQLYGKRFMENPKLRSKLLKRMILGDFVIDNEELSGLDDQTIEVIVIYQVRSGLIHKCQIIKA